MTDTATDPGATDTGAAGGGAADSGDTGDSGDRGAGRTVTVRDTSGADAGEVRLDDSLFGVTPNVSLMHQVVTAQLAAARSGTQSTQTRAEARGGGAKPWRQKGTGRARQGSIRSPQWRGGGVALGPKPRSYRQRTPKKMVRGALASALSDRAADGRIVVVTSWDFDQPSTRSARAALVALGITGRALVVLEPGAQVAQRSFRNLPDVHTLVPGELNAYDVLCNDWILFTRATLPGATVEPSTASTASAASAADPASGAPAEEAS
jgi:large subunit ribosomal protein L4